MDEGTGGLRIGLAGVSRWFTMVRVKPIMSHETAQPEGFRYDVFLSHRRKDKPVVRRADLDADFIDFVDAAISPRFGVRQIEATSPRSRARWGSFFASTGTRRITRGVTQLPASGLDA